MLISLNFQKLDSLLVIYIINILNYLKTLQESQHNAPTLNGNPQYQNATISPIKVPNSSLTSNDAYTQVLVLSPFSNQSKRDIFNTHKTQRYQMHNLNSYKLIFPNLKFTSQASIPTKQSNFLGYSFIITPFKTIETIN